MLQLQTKFVDICRISKLLVKYNVKSSITNNVITLDGDICDELLNQLCDSLDISAIQNFANNEVPIIHNETPFIRGKKDILCETVDMEPLNVESSQGISTLSHSLSECNLIYSEVKRGEVYMCDFGTPYGSEQGFKRYAIIVQNDDGNLYSPTTIVVICTTQHKKTLPVHYNCTFSTHNMIDYDPSRVSSEENIVMAEQIKTIDKTRLRKYIGTLTPEFMQILQSKIDISLHLSREVKTIVKQEKVYVDRPVYQRPMVDSGILRERKDVNMVQVRLLSFVDINKLLKISQSNFTDEVKAQKILELFGFDFKKNGAQYLLKAILVSPKNAYFNLETLCEIISNKEGVEKEEIKRLLVARVKETFGFKKAPTIDFIRLINSFLVKQEADYEEANI